MTTTNDTTTTFAPTANDDRVLYTAPAATQGRIIARHRANLNMRRRGGTITEITDTEDKPMPKPTPPTTPKLTIVTKIAAAEVQPEAAPTPERYTGRLYGGMEHSADGANAGKLAAILEEQFGLATPPPSMGTNITNMKGLTASRRKWEKSPEAVEGLRKVWHAIKAEQREDIEVPASEIVMNDDGTITWGEGDFGLESRGLKALCSRNSKQFPRAGAYMAAITSELRAANWNHQRVLIDPTHKISLRTRAAQGTRQVYAVTSPSYTVFDANMVAEVVGKALNKMGGTAPRGETFYSPNTTAMRCDATFHAESVVDFAAGDVFQIGVRFRSNDAGAGAIKGEFIAYRPTCMNFSIISTTTAEAFSIPHKGDLGKMVGEVQEALGRLDAVRAAFTGDWSVLRNTKVDDIFHEYDGVEGVFRAMADCKRLDLPGGDNKAVVKRLMTMMQYEVGDSVADVINALTATHNDRQLTEEQHVAYETAGGLLVPILAEACRGNDRPLKALALPLPAEA